MLTCSALQAREDGKGINVDARVKVQGVITPPNDLDKLDDAASATKSCSSTTSLGSYHSDLQTHSRSCILLYALASDFAPLLFEAKIFVENAVHTPASERHTIHSFRLKP